MFHRKKITTFVQFLPPQLLLVFNLKKINDMKDFLLVFRADYSNMIWQGTPEEMQATTKRWMDWIGGIAAQNKLADRGNRLAVSGKVVNPGNVVTDGPYTEIKESIGGYSIVKAASLDEAVELAKGCPIYAAGGNVEVREIENM
jgi:hypothetical protein